MKLTLVESHMLTDKIRMFLLKPTLDSDILTDAVPGKHFNFQFIGRDKRLKQRSYTLVSQDINNHYKFIIENRGCDSESSTIWKLLLDNVGISIFGIGGEITFDTIKNSRNVLLLAGGIGITLPISLIYECAKYYSHIMSGKNIQLVISYPSLRDIPYLNELLDFHMKYQWFTLRVNITRSKLRKTSDIINMGRIDLATEKTNGIPDTVVICGSRMFTESMIKGVRCNFPQASIFTEFFGSTQVQLTNSEELNKDKSIVRVKDFDTPLLIDNNRTVLDNLLQNNILIRYICYSGICGSCKYRLIRGSVLNHPDFCLTEKEKAENIYLACCSFPKTDIDIELV